MKRELPTKRAHAPRILLAEDDTELRDLLASVLRKDGFDVLTAADGVELLQRLRVEPDLDLLVTDIRMPGFRGLDVVHFFRCGLRATPVVFITAFGDPETHHEARHLGAKAVFDKPFDLDDFRTAVWNLVCPAHDSPRLRRETQ